MNRLTRAGGNLLLLFFSLIFTGGLMEVGTRLFSDIGPSLLVVGDVRGKHWLDGYDAPVLIPEAGRRVRLRFHRDGFRGADRPYPKPPGVWRVAVLGDSMIAAVGVDEALTLVGQLEAGLNLDLRAGPAVHGGSVEVMNFGVSSASTGQELVTYRQVAHRYHPDLVVLAFNAGNDLADNCLCLSRAHRIYFELDPAGRLVERFDAPPAAALGGWLDVHSRFYVWQKMAFARLRAGLREREGRLEPGAEIFRVDHTAPVEEAWRISAALFAAIQAEAAADGARLVVLLVPAPEEIFDDLWQELQRRAGADAGALDRRNPRRRLAAITQSLELPFLDLGEELRAAAPHRSSTLEAEQVFFRRRFHLNERGNRLAAEALRAFLARLPASPGQTR